MSFESLSFRYEVTINNFPQRWLPLIHLYDPDLPQFPLYYFHSLPSDLPPNTRPSETDRIFGYVEMCSFNNDVLTAHLVINKDLHDPINEFRYKDLVQYIVRERFGINNPVVRDDIIGVFNIPPFSTKHNLILEELWSRVVRNFYGDKLPFGRLWDEVLGLTRFVASWYSPGGRKSEFIQTHYFASKFGEKISSANGNPNVDFYLLPTYQELTNTSNPLDDFRNYKALVTVAGAFTNLYCTSHKIIPARSIGGLTSNLVSLKPSGDYKLNLSNFSLPVTPAMPDTELNTKKLFEIIDTLPITSTEKSLAIECYNAFDKGPRRPVIFLLLLNDIRQGLLKPETIVNSDMEIVYTQLDGTYHSRKAISIYAQQCFGNEHAFPIDTWIETFLKVPLSGHVGKRGLSKLYRNSVRLGKVERLIWAAAQARKVHASACNDALWCLKFGDTDSEYPRGANPLSCTICLDTIRNSCPAFDNIRNHTIEFDSPTSTIGVNYRITTGYPTSTNFIKCEENSSKKDRSIDSFSPKDMNLFNSFPQPSHIGRGNLTVQDFIIKYKR